MKLNQKLVKNFLKFDIRWKLLRIGHHIGLRLWPNYISKSGIKSIISKILFNLIYYEKSKKRKKQLQNEFSFIRSSKFKKTNFLISSPSSGGNYIRNLLSSHFEIFYKIGNGIPKFNNITNKFMFSISPICSGDIFNFIELERTALSFKFFSKDDFDKKKVMLTRFPYPSSDVILHPNLYKSEEIKPLILFRDPFDWLISRYVKYENKKFQNTNEVDEKLLSYQISDYNKYISYWLNYTSSNNTNEYLLINFELLTQNGKEVFKKILSFFNYEILKDETLEYIIKINSKEFSIENLGVEFTGTRFTNNDRKIKVIEKIKEYIHNNTEFKDLSRKAEKLKKNINV